MVRYHHGMKGRRARPFLIAACQSILIMSPKARAAVADWRLAVIKKEGGKTPFEKRWDTVFLRESLD